MIPPALFLMALVSPPQTVIPGPSVFTLVGSLSCAVRMYDQTTVQTWCLLGPSFAGVIHNQVDQIPLPGAGMWTEVSQDTAIYSEPNGTIDFISWQVYPNLNYQIAWGTCQGPPLPPPGKSGQSGACTWNPLIVGTLTAATVIPAPQ